MDPRLQQASPLIVIGMHRSGTRLLARILERLGVFMGADQQADSESITFMSINEGILHQCGAFWSEPMSAHFLLSQPDFVESVAASVRATLAARQSDYFGPSDLQSNTVKAAVVPFGWKDPRNTFTLPVWRSIFPGARVIHLVRHGVDVAASLARRHAAALRAAADPAMPAALTVIQDHGLGVLSSRRGWTLAEALTMWEQYVEKARLEAAEVGADALEIRFEELLADPAPVVTEIAEFCGVAVPEDPGELPGNIKSSRAFAFRRQPELVAFAESARAVLDRFDYAP